MNAGNPTAPAAADVGFAPVENELPLRWLRRLHAVPASGLGTVRRALFFALLTWLPIAIWAAMTGHMFNDRSSEALLGHYGIHVRCLLAIPLFILAERPLNDIVRRIGSHFMTSGVLPESQHAAFRQSIVDVCRLRDSSLPWIFVGGMILAWTVIDQPSAHEDALAWSLSPDGKMGFGGWWFAYVGRPIFLALLVGWLWRILLVAYWFWRVGRLELSLVPAHPDHLGGLAFVEKLPGAFALVTFALSAAITSRWAHEIAFHGLKLESLKLPAALFVFLWTLFALLPLLALSPPLHATRKHALPKYAALVGVQGRLVHRRWILGETVQDTGILDAPEIGPVADAASMFDAVKRMRIVPIGKSSLFRILVPIALPMIVIVAMQIPIGELLLKIVNAVL